MKSIKNGTFYPGEGELIPCEGKFDGGYWVSLAGYETRVSQDAISETLLFDIVEAYRLLALEQSCFVGIWQDAGHVYFDLSEYYASRVQAIGLGKARGQLAIWDIAKGEAISLEKLPHTYEHGKFVGISSLSADNAKALAIGASLRATANDFNRD